MSSVMLTTGRESEVKTSIVVSKVGLFIIIIISELYFFLYIFFYIIIILFIYIYRYTDIIKHIFSSF